MKTRNRLYDKSRLRLFCLLTALLGLFGAGQTWAQTQPSGAGTQASPYQIGTADELRWFANQVNSGNTAAWAVLTTSINLGGEAWTPIGTSISNRYTGTFDGAGHTIDGMTIQSTGYNMGFVGYLYTNGVIQNLTLGENCSVSCDGNYVGGICGYNYGGTITGCTNHGTVNNTGTGDKYTGGICAYNRSGSTVTGCTNTGTVSGTGTYVGGVCGCTSGTVTNSTHTGTVSGTGTYVGGICAYNNRSTVDNCYWLEGTCDKGIGGSASGGTTNAEEKTATEFASGEVAFLLNGSSSDSPVWYQNLGEGGDPYPVPDSSHGIVYAEQYCNGTATGNYSNSSNSSHANYENGFCTLCGTYQPAELNGDVYEISNAGQLFWFAGLVNGTLTDGTTQNAAANAALLNNITIPADMAWTPIGSASTIYTGAFNGQNHTISGMKIESTAEYQGFVGYLGTGTIKNLTLGEDCSVTGDKYSGGICGWNNVGIISGCTNKGAVNGNGDLGGICGHNLGTVENCVNTGKVTNSGAETVGGICGYSSTSLIGCTNSGVIDGSDQRHVGGICGYIDNGDKGVTVSVCTNTGAVTGYNERVGGICGFGDVTITNCWNSGAITGGTNVGGICGENHSKAGTIMNCYSTGEVKGTDNVGGICGENNRTVDNSYWLEETCDVGIGNSSGTEKSEDDFKSGTVAYLLQGDQTTQAWGQTLGTDNYPVLTTDEAMRVYAAKLYKGSADDATDVYANASGISSPEGNAILVIEDAVSAPTGTNVVVKNSDAYTCANLVLTDGADFYTPVTFTAGKATYSRTLPETSTWGTIVLPFEATTTDANLYEATDVVVAGSEESILAVQPVTGGALEAHTPALFQGEMARITVTFSATGVEVAATENAVLTKTIGESGYILTGSLSTIDALSEGDLFIARDKFWSVGTQNTVRMQAFRAYIDAPEAGPAQVNVLRILVGDATSIRQALSDGTLPVDVYNLQGVQLRKNVARDAALEGLPAGIYIVGGKKVVKK